MSVPAPLAEPAVAGPGAPTAGKGADRGALGRAVSRGWSSPTMMTWASYLTLSLNFVLVLPLVLTRLPAADIALWYLFASLTGLQLLADMGFSPSFVRVIAYAMGGARIHEMRSYLAAAEPRERRDPDWGAVDQIWATMGMVYARLTLLAVAALALLGTLAVARPISISPQPGRAWAAWAVILVGSTVALRGNRYAAYLQGVNEVAVLRRWEAITNVCTIVASALVLLAGGDLLAVVVVGQLGIVLNITRNWWLSRVVQEGRLRTFTARRADPEVVRVVWPNAWRSGLGVLMGHAPVQFTGLVYAQFGTPAGVASYLLALNLLTACRMFSAAPFYSKIPVLARLRAEGELERQRQLAQRGMRLAYWTFVLPTVGAGLLGAPLLKLLGSNAEFPDPLLWALLAVGMLLERYGAMHLHLYSTSNHVTWHIANGVTAALYVLASASLFGVMGIYAFAVAYIASYLAFYAWYSGRQSYRSMSVRFWGFERGVLIAPAVVLLLFSSLSIAGWLTRQ